VLDVLGKFSPMRPATALPLRMPVQAVYKFDDRRIVAGRVETGRIAVGDEIVIMPGRKIARVRAIEAWPAPGESGVPRQALAGQSVGIVLDRDIFVDRGDVISAVETPPEAAHRLRARVFWLHDESLAVGATVTVCIGMAESRGIVASIDNAVDPGQLSSNKAGSIAQNHIGEIEIALSQPVAADVHAVNPRTGRIVLDLAGRIAGGGLVLAIDGAGGRRANSDSAVPASPGEARAREPGADRIDLVAHAAHLNIILAQLSPAERIARFRREIDGKIVFTTSFGLEDQVIIHLLAEHAVDVDIATLDTARLFPETYDLWAETERRFGRRIRAIYPENANLEALIETHGINGFYGSRAARSACCHVRKVEPLNRALAGAQAWITGLRADQSSHRQAMELVTADVDRNLLKLNPLFDWTREAVLTFVHANDVPINPLHDKGFASIGCAPCTRAIAPGEPERAGRWWWEQEDNKECGLHVLSDGRVPPGASRRAGGEYRQSSLDRR
jgi:phosphoadenosine phosphosulfate reductase